MQPISSYSTSDAFLRLLLQGDPKSGKTTMACQFPGVYVIDVDLNLAGPLRWLKENNKTLPVGYDVLDKDETGKEVPMSMRYQRFMKLMTEAHANPDIKTILIDSATGFVDVLMEETKRLQPNVKDGRQLFGFFFMYGKTFLEQLRKQRKHIIMTVHEKLEKTPDGAIILPYRISWPGQLGYILASFFTDVWRCEVMSTPSGLQTTYKWQVRTMPDYQYKLGNSLGLPPVFEFKWDVIQEKLDQLK